MKIYVSLPEEILSNNLAEFWNHLEFKVRQEYPKAHIISNYTGNGSLEDADIVLFLYEYKDTESCKKDKQKCRDLDKIFNYFIKFYATDRFYCSDLWVSIWIVIDGDSRIDHHLLFWKKGDIADM